MTDTSVLLVEDDKELREGMSEFLKLYGFSVTAVASGLDFFRVIMKLKFQVAIVDLGLPDLDGQEIVQYLRKESDTAIIVLTASNMLDTRINSYQHGADLFLSKPVDTKELVAAIVSLASRREPSVSNVPAESEEGRWLIKPKQRALIAPCGVCITFTSMEFQFLELLINENGTTLSKEQLCECLYRRQDESAFAALATIVKRIRRRISNAGVKDQIIMTSHGKGYSIAINL